MNNYPVYVLMNRYALLLIFLFFSTAGYSQNRFAIDAGIGQPPSYHPFLDFSDGPKVVQAASAAPSVAISWLRKAGGHMYIGSKLTFNSYHFTYTSNWNNTSDSSAITTVVIKSTYVGIGPVLDAGIGKRQYVHLFLMPAINFLLKGSMSTEVYQNYAPTPPYNHTHTASGYLNPIMLYVNCGLVEHVPVNKEWHIMLTETLNMITRTPIADAKGTNGLTILPNYLSLQLGIMHKYHSREYYARQK